MKDDQDEASKPASAPAPAPSPTWKKRTPSAKTLEALKAHAFKKGQVANPTGIGGRPKSVRARIAELTNNGEEIVQFYVDVMRSPDGKVRDRIESANRLGDRFWGRAPETIVNVDAESSTSSATREMAADALEMLARTLREEEADVQAEKKAEADKLEAENPPLDKVG